MFILLGCVLGGMIAGSIMGVFVAIFMVKKRYIHIEPINEREEDDIDATNRPGTRSSYKKELSGALQINPKS